MHRPLHVDSDFGRRAAAFGVAEFVEPLESEVGAVLRQFFLKGIGLDDFGEAQARSPAEDHEVDQAVGSEPVGSVNRHARSFANGEQARHHCVRVAVLQRDDLSVVVRGDSAHIVVDGGDHGDRLAGQIDSRESLGGFGDPGQPFVEDLRIEMVKVEEDMVLVLANSAPFSNLHGHRT